MKNLLIYVNPAGFDEFNEKLVKIQIDNSLELGWSPEDITLVTDFPYEYNKIKAHVVEEGYCPFKSTASKALTISYLCKTGFFEDTVYWAHDLDAFQLEPITEEELGLEGVDVGFCDYGRKPNWQLGSFFFRKSAEDILITIGDGVEDRLDDNKRVLHDETVLLNLTNDNVDNINSRIKRMNVTYDFGLRKISLCYDKADKPIKVLHFQPYSKFLPALDMMMYGKNDIGKPLMNKRLIKIFERYNIK